MCLLAIDCAVVAKSDATPHGAYIIRTSIYMGKY